MKDQVAFFQMTELTSIKDTTSQNPSKNKHAQKLETQNCGAQIMYSCQGCRQ